MTVGSLFSGIGGFDLAFTLAGFQVSWMCEIDKSCRSILNRPFPGVQIYEDVKEINSRTAPRVDVLVGGFPCQDLSVAGRREGLAGERSGLWFVFARIIGELNPRWVVIENVPGLLSSDGGRDLAVILHQLVEFGYGVAWRVLDAQYFGVAQGRRRVFIVGHLGDGRAAQVFFEPEGMFGNPPSRREKGERVAQDVAGSIGSHRTGGWGNDLDNNGAFITARNSGRGYWMEDDIAATVGREKRGVFESTCIAHTLTKRHDSSEGGCGRGTPLTVAFVQNTRDEVRLQNGDGQIVGAQSAEPGMKQQAYVSIAPTLRAMPNQGPGRMADDAARMMMVRRLTPLECERLQGFPDNWTEGQSDSTRYKQIGNAVAVPVVEWIAKRIMEASA